MSRYDGGWPRYVPVAERRRKAEREMEKLRKKGYSAAPIRIEGRTIVTSFWGKAWCDNLESYRDYESRLPRGRTYVRNGSVVDLRIAPREVTAMVSGSSIYRVAISIGTVQRVQWQSICADCGNGIDSVVELLQGRLSKGVMERLCRQDNGLFPRPSDIRFTCSCPDYASMCKHVAAVLYGVGARLDHEPELLFRLRAVDENDLVAQIGTVLPMAKKSPAAGRVLEVDDVSALFGLDLVGADAAQAPAGDASAAPSSPDAHEPSSTCGRASTPERVDLKQKTLPERTGSRRRAEQKEGKAPKPGVLLRSARAAATRAQAFPSIADVNPDTRRETVARAASAGTRDRPTEIRKKANLASTKANSRKTPASRDPKVSVVSRVVAKASRPAGSVVSKIQKEEVKPGQRVSRKPPPMVAVVTGAATRTSSNEPRRKVTIQRSPRPVKWWLPSYKA